MDTMNIFQELKARGFCYQQTDEEAIEKLLSTERVKFYVGFDPTGNSLHVGHLLPVMAMRLMQKAGHIPIVLVGGATARIGDPSGKKTARPMMTLETIAENVACLQKQLSRFIRTENGEAHFVNNADWLCKIGYIDMLREVGTIFSVNRMMAQESVKSRLEDGLTFLEFNYSILQAYDFMVLNRDFGCKLEMGGQDQWGNMVAGTELIRRKLGREVHCMTIPLLMDSNGEKFGKTAGGNNVWLDVNRTSVFDYYQFWRNSDDSQVEKLMLYFSPLPVDEIRRICDPAGNINRAKEILAYELTALVHGEEEAKKAEESAKALFGAGGNNANMPTSTLTDADFENGNINVLSMLVATGLCPSRGEARRLVQQGGVTIDDVKVASIDESLARERFEGEGVIVRKGKKVFHRVKA